VVGRRVGHLPAQGEHPRVVRFGLAAERGPRHGRAQVRGVPAAVAEPAGDRGGLHDAGDLRGRERPFEHVAGNERRGASDPFEEDPGGGVEVRGLGEAAHVLEVDAGRERDHEGAVVGDGHGDAVAQDLVGVHEDAERIVAAGARVRQEVGAREGRVQLPGGAVGVGGAGILLAAPFDGGERLGLRRFGRDGGAALLERCGAVAAGREVAGHVRLSIRHARMRLRCRRTVVGCPQPVVRLSANVGGGCQAGMSVI
jgi:hypothetical protein